MSNGFIFGLTVVTDMKNGIINFHALARCMSQSNWNLKRPWDSGM
jgi:hypothetical protein